MKKDIDFLPENYHETKAQRHTNIVCLGLFVLVVCGVGIGSLLIKQRCQEMNQQVGKINLEMAKAGESLKKLELLESKKKMMTSKAAISALLMEQVPRSLLLATITNKLPSNVSLLSYSLNSEKVVEKKTQKTKSSRKKTRKKGGNAHKKKVDLPKKMKVGIELSGLASTDIDVAQLIDNLNKSALFEYVNLILSEEFPRNDEILRHFKLKIAVSPNAKVSQKDIDLARSRHISGM